MNEKPRPAGRRRDRLLGTTLLVGGLAVAGGAAHAADGGVLDARPEAVGVVQAGSAVPVAVVADVEAAPVAGGDGTTGMDAALDAFFAAGYDDDAVALADVWGSATPYDAKVAAGQMLLAGQALPVRA